MSFLCFWMVFSGVFLRRRGDEPVIPRHLLFFVLVLERLCVQVSVERAVSRRQVCLRTGEKGKE